MRLRFLIAALLLVLLAPLAQAQGPGVAVDKITLEIDQTASGNDVARRVELTVTDVAALNASAGFELHLDKEASAVNATIERAGQSQALPLQAPTIDGLYQVHRANLSAAHPDLRDGDKLVLTVTYSTDSFVSERLPYGAAQLVAYARGQGDDVAFSRDLGQFNPTNEGNEHHAVKANAPAGFAYTVGFFAVQQTEGPAARDLNPYLLLVAGLVAGFLLAWFLSKRKPQAKKFQKGGGMESGDMLEARRRTLMAALKELELAHEAKEIPDSAYAPLKEEYKAQTVRVLRSIEDKKEAPGSRP